MPVTVWDEDTAREYVDHRRRDYLEAIARNNETAADVTRCALALNDANHRLSLILNKDHT